MKTQWLYLLIDNYQIMVGMMLITIVFLIIWNKKIHGENSEDTKQISSIEHKYTYFLSRMDIMSAEIGVIVAIGIGAFIALIFGIGWLMEKI